MKKNNYVLIEYLGENPISARLETNGEKVEFETGDVHFCVSERAEALISAYKFEYVNPLRITSEMIVKAQKRIEAIMKEAERVNKDLDKAIAQSRLEPIEGVGMETEEVKEEKPRKRSRKSTEEVGAVEEV